jgi:hypothetical protein
MKLLITVTFLLSPLAAVAGWHDEDFSTTPIPLLEQARLRHGMSTDALSEVKVGVVLAKQKVSSSSHYYRRLQSQFEFTNEACNNTYNELWSDADLKAAYDAYVAQVDADAANIEKFCNTNYYKNSITCKVDDPVAIDTQFQNACTAAGGKVDAFPLDLACTMSYSWDDWSVFLDMPDAFDCFPADSQFEEQCGDEVADFEDLALILFEEEIESMYRMSGFTRVNCDVGAVSKPAAGNTDDSSSAAAPRSIWNIVVFLTLCSINKIIEIEQ